jgi:hypothetical protein
VVDFFAVALGCALLRLIADFLAWLGHEKVLHLLRARCAQMIIRAQHPSFLDRERGLFFYFAVLRAARKSSLSRSAQK